jgi:transcriptional regulator GlxA family with amidase domain
MSVAHGSPGTGLALDGIAIDLLSQVWLNSEAPRPTATPARVTEQVEAARSHLEQNFSTQVTLADLAEVVNLSAFHLHRLFRERVGVTPHRYLTRLRLAHALQLLATTDLTVATIASQSGFASGSHLARICMQRFGKTPTQLRAPDHP